MDKVNDLVVKFCRPIPEGNWAKNLQNGFGAFTPCFMETVVVNVSYLVLLGLTLKRIQLLRSRNLKRYTVRYKFMHVIAVLLALACAAAPIVQIFLKFSIINTEGQDNLPPFEVRRETQGQRALGTPHEMPHLWIVIVDSDNPANILSCVVRRVRDSGVGIVCKAIFYLFKFIYATCVQYCLIPYVRLV